MRPWSFFSVILFGLFCTGCLPEPWFVRQSIYQVYKEPVYQDKTQVIRTDGYYVQQEEHNPRRDARSILVFRPDGYSFHTSFFISEGIDEAIQKNWAAHDTIQRELDWWKVTGDSLVIEYFGTPKWQMFTTKFFQRGRILNDSTLLMKFDNSTYNPVHFQFVKWDSMPVIDNSARYASKGWYQERVNRDRRRW